MLSAVVLLVTSAGSLPNMSGCFGGFSRVNVCIERYIVTDAWQCGRAVYLTAADMRTKQNIYGLPVSQWYGCEIEEV